ncbi:hypothetical protein R3P38DRAFT_2788143 [Favolaschia claudopus]|uniref:Uncharacterized protein n=1 Tax=Favolaschia claudopus TaxID=2862362 RepID=A0AAW0ALZ1_9AGAR
MAFLMKGEATEVMGFIRRSAVKSQVPRFPGWTFDMRLLLTVCDMGYLDIAGQIVRVSVKRRDPQRKGAEALRIAHDIEDAENSKWPTLTERCLHPSRLLVRCIYEHAMPVLWRGRDDGHDARGRLQLPPIGIRHAKAKYRAAIAGGKPEVVPRRSLKPGRKGPSTLFSPALCIPTALATRIFTPVWVQGADSAVSTLSSTNINSQFKPH